MSLGVVCLSVCVSVSFCDHLAVLACRLASEFLCERASVHVRVPVNVGV